MKECIWSSDAHVEALVLVQVTDEGAECGKDVKKPLSVTHDPSLLLLHSWSKGPYSVSLIFF